MKMLITGASSYVGARLYADLNKRFDVEGTYNTNKLFPELAKMDITERISVDTVIKECRPDVIVHVAANPNARWCEANPELAIRLNEYGTQNIVDANKSGAKIFYISSVAAVSPTSVYGKTKRASEDIIRSSKNDYIILRPSLIIGYSPNTSNDRPFNRILKNIDEKSPAVYDTSWKFQPTWLGHISEIIEATIEKEIVNEIIPVTVPELKSRFDVAKDILAKFDIPVQSVDNHDKTQTVKVGQEKLEELGLSRYSYWGIIDKIVDEINHRERFNINSS